RAPSGPHPDGQSPPARGRGGMSVAVLTYHSLDTSGAVTATDPGWFAETMHRLREAGWRAIDLEGWIASGRPSLDRAFAVTFDDGLASTLAAEPTLRHHGIPAHVFVVTDSVGGTAEPMRATADDCAWR